MKVTSRGYGDFARGPKWDLPLVPPDPDKLQGPEVGATVRYSKPGSRDHGKLMTVLHRYYHWSPEVVIYHDDEPVGRGYLHYDWTVVELTNESGNVVAMVVDDDTLEVQP
jgi:hypothetical protein